MLKNALYHHLWKYCPLNNDHSILLFLKLPNESLSGQAVKSKIEIICL